MPAIVPTFLLVLKCQPMEVGRQKSTAKVLTPTMYRLGQCFWLLDLAWFSLSYCAMEMNHCMKDFFLILLLFISCICSLLSLSISFFLISSLSFSLSLCIPLKLINKFYQKANNQLSKVFGQKELENNNNGSN